MSYDSFCADIAALYASVGSLTEAAPPAPLGSVQRIPATAENFIHGFILTSSGAIVGDARFDMTRNFDSTIHESIGLEAGEGEQLWVLVANNTGSDIARGVAVAWDGVADNLNLYSVIPADSSELSQMIGVAQFVIPAGKAAYVLVSGAGVIKSVAGSLTSSRGAALKCGAAGEAAIASAGDPSFGILLDDAVAGAGDIANALINLRR